MAITARDDDPPPISPLVKPVAVVIAALIVVPVVWWKTRMPSGPIDTPAPAAPATPATPAMPAKPLALPDVRTGREAPGDLVFTVIDVAFQSSGTTVHCRCMFEGKEIGFGAFVKTGMKGTSPPSKDAFARDGVTFHSAGAPSDAFVAALAKLWKTKAAPAGMKETLACTSAILQGDTNDLKQRPAKIKVFFGDGKGQPSTDYAELYFNVDLAKNQAELLEKDPEYREAAVRALGR